MRHHPTCWNKVLAKLGFRRVRSARKATSNDWRRISQIEPLEARQYLAADTYIVTTLEDVATAPGSNSWRLREALAHSAADASPGEDIIRFDGLSGTIELDPLLGQLPISRNVKIAGPGADKLTVDAKGASRVFYMSSGSESTISGLTITGGGNVSNGGGIYNLGGDLTLDSVIITGNTASGGGGIATYNWYTSPGSLRITNSTIDGNRAGAGSGIQVIASSGAEIVIDSSTVSNNRAIGIETASYSEGGGLSVAGDSSSSVTITNSTFSGNAALHGGAIRFYNSATPTSIVNTTIANNTGAGIDRVSTSAAVAIHNSIVAGNLSVLGASLDVINNFAPLAVRTTSSVAEAPAGSSTAQATTSC